MAEFVVVWTDAERLGDGIWYAAGVARSCRWLATVPAVELNGRRFPLRSPVSKREGRAYEELIQAEYIAAEKLQFEHPRPHWLRARDGWIDGIAAALRWAWARKGPDPLEVPALDGLR